MPLLSKDQDVWSTFLSRLSGDSAEEHGFVARNFLLEEGTRPERIASYRDWSCMVDHGTVESWKKVHEDYLNNFVFRDPATFGLPLALDPADEYSCPETFRFLDPNSPYLMSDGKIYLIRLETTSFLARYGGQSEAEVKRLAEAVLSSGDDQARLLFESVLSQWSQNIQIRPVFAAFFHEVRDLFGRQPEEDAEDWADDLRDRLGLCHLDPGATRTAIDILAFRYPVAAVPSLTGQPREMKPLIQPTVLDGRHSRAFCPAPEGSQTGHVIDLSGSVEKLHREVLHPSLGFRPEHLWRVGTIRRPVDLTQLPTARGRHLQRVRAISGRDDYAQSTDGDLLT